MESDTQNLSSKQKELVAVGASIGAGCQPCVSHHLKAGADAGLDGGQLLAALAGAERVASEATVLVADHARGQLGPAAATPAALAPLEDALAALGAALAANDASAIELQVRAALDFGASRSQLQQAIETAKNVQENAGRIHAQNAERLLDSVAAPQATDETEAVEGTGCGCGGDHETEAAPVAEQSTTGEFEPSTAACFGSAGNGEGAGPAAMIAHCRRMIGDLFGKADAPAETSVTPAATAAKGCTANREV